MALFNYEMLQGIKLEENEKYDFLMSSVNSSIDEQRYKILKIVMMNLIYFYLIVIKIKKLFLT